MDNKSIFNKKNIIIFSIIIMVIVIFIILLLINNNKKELVLKCRGNEQTNQYFKTIRYANVYTQGKKIIFNDNLDVTKLMDNEKVNSIINNYFAAYIVNDKNTNNNFLSVKENGNQFIYMLNIEITNYTLEELKEFIDISDISVLALEQYLIEDGLTCEKY